MERRELELNLDTEIYMVGVPADDIRERGAQCAGESAVSRAQIQISALRAVRRWIALGERWRHREATNFAQDVVILWHLGDARVRLIGPPDMRPCELHDRTVRTYDVRCLNESNRRGINPAGMFRVTTVLNPGIYFMINEMPPPDGPTATRAEAETVLQRWVNGNKKTRERGLNHVTNVLFALWRADRSLVTIA